MRYANTEKLFTLEGMIVFTITLAITLFLCRPRQAKTQTMTTQHTGHATRQLSFQEARTPHELRCLLERRHMVVFALEVREGRLEYLAETKAGGLPCRFRLVYEAGTPALNQYTWHMEMSWAHLKADLHDYYRKSAGSWFDLWSQDFAAATASTPVEGDKRLYQERVAQALEAESHLEEAAAIQQEILKAMREGATFSTAHKEGGTRISHAGGTFFMRDFGESTAERRFTQEADFLASLRRFFDADLQRGSLTGALSETDAWRLILRRLDPGK